MPNAIQQVYEEPAMPTDEELKKAFKAFKKRLKATQLDEDSRLGRGPLTSGGAGVQSIIPPREYPKEIWDELARRGQITPEGDGFYRLGGFKGGM